MAIAENLPSGEKQTFEELVAALKEIKGRRGALKLGRKVRMVAETYIEFQATASERAVLLDLL